MADSLPGFCSDSNTDNPAFAAAVSNYCCFRMGTHILSSNGEVLVENIAEGDRLCTVDGGVAVVKWIGWRSVNIAAHPTPETVSPICFARGSIAENTPHRDLYVSPAHAMYFDGALIPASALVNGTTVAQAPANEVVYYHVELEAHGVIFAEGAPSESFLEIGDNRSSFANTSGPVVLRPDFGARINTARTASGDWRHWLAARVSGVGSRLYRSGQSIGARRLGDLALRLSLGAVRRLTGACAPHAYFGPKVDEARRQLAIRAETLEAARTDARKLCA